MPILKTGVSVKYFHRHLAWNGKDLCKLTKSSPALGFSASGETTGWTFSGTAIQSRPNRKRSQTHSCRVLPCAHFNCGVPTRHDRGATPPLLQNRGDFRPHRDVSGIQSRRLAAQVEFKLHLRPEDQAVCGAAEMEHAELIAFAHMLPHRHSNLV